MYASHISGKWYVALLPLSIAFHACKLKKLVDLDAVVVCVKLLQFFHRSALQLALSMKSVVVIDEGNQLFFSHVTQTLCIQVRVLLEKLFSVVVHPFVEGLYDQILF